MDSESKNSLLSMGCLLFLIIGGFIVFLNKGSWDRVISNFNKDVFTAKDMIYQTGNVRVYKFMDGTTTCYLADKQALSTAIFCK